MHKEKKNVIAESQKTIKKKKRSSVHVPVQFRLKALGFMIFDPNQLTYLESVICSLLLAVGQMEFSY